MYKYNYHKNIFWTNDSNIKYISKNNFNPYILSKLIKNEFKKNNNNKYFYLLTLNSIFINHKLNIILMTHTNKIPFKKKLDYSNFLIIYLLKYISFENNINLNILEILLSKIFYLLKQDKYIKRGNKKQSYNFCKYKYKCKSFYVKKSCNFDHYCYNKLCIDIQNLIHNLYKLSKEDIKKYIVTIHYVIDHLYDEYFMYRYINNINK